ncbi:MAG TPA: hypothetical protein VGE77_01745 [Nocardioides sp.]
MDIPTTTSSAANGVYSMLVSALDAMYEHAHEASLDDFAHYLALARSELDFGPWHAPHAYPLDERLPFVDGIQAVHRLLIALREETPDDQIAHLTIALAWHWISDGIADLDRQAARIAARLRRAANASAVGA